MLALGFILLALAVNLASLRSHFGVTSGPFQERSGGQRKRALRPRKCCSTLGLCQHAQVSVDEPRADYYLRVLYI